MSFKDWVRQDNLFSKLFLLWARLWRRVSSIDKWFSGVSAIAAVVPLALVWVDPQWWRVSVVVMLLLLTVLAWWYWSGLEQLGGWVSWLVSLVIFWGASFMLWLVLDN